MRKVIDVSLIAVCALTIADTDFANFSVLDGLSYACMGIALISAVALFVMRRKGERP